MPTEANAPLVSAATGAEIKPSGVEVPVRVAPAVGAVPPTLADHSLWGEVAAVLAVGVLPNLVSAVSLLLHAYKPAPYWLEALQLILLSACTIFVTLYLIGRSGETWGRFGLSRPRVWDVVLGVGMFLAAIIVYLFRCGLMIPDSAPSIIPSPAPHGPLGLILMTLKWGASAFSEELVTRAYLITRLEVLLGSRGTAVLASTALFASYHVYQGVAGVEVATAFGLTYGCAYLLFRRIWPLAIGHALTNLRLDLMA